MKKFLIVIISAMGVLLNAQVSEPSISVAEKFSKAPDKIIKSLIMYDERYSSIFGDQAYVSLIQYSEFNGKDTVYGLKFYGNVIIAMSKELTIKKKYSVVLDYNEINKIMLWIEFVKGNSGNMTSAKNKISIAFGKGNLLLRYYNDAFEIQYDKFDENSITKMGKTQLDNLYNKLSEIKGIGPKS
jgi:hypothetical protein